MSNPRPSTIDQLATPSGIVDGGETTNNFHPSKLLGVRIPFLQGDYLGALEKLGSTPYPITDRNGAEPAKAWCVMRAEIAIAQQDFTTAADICLTGDRLYHPGLAANPLYAAMFCSIHAEALRRQGNLTESDAETLLTILGRISSIKDPVGRRQLFVEYTLCRTLGLHEGQETSSGRELLARASRARHAYISDHRGGYRAIITNARPDRDKLILVNESPFFTAVMSLPFTAPNDHR